MSAGLKRFLWIWGALTAALLAYGLYEAVHVPPDAEQGDVYRIFFYHFPNWMALSIFLLVNLAASIFYLVARSSKEELALKADALAVASAEMGTIYCLLGLATGSLWGKVAWGIWWTWDARLTSTLLLWLIYLAYLAVRNFGEGPSMRTIAAVIAIFGYIDVPIVYMTTRWYRTQHPAPVFGGEPGSGVDPRLQPAVWSNVFAWIAWGVLIVAFRYAYELRRQRVEAKAADRALEAAA